MSGLVVTLTEYELISVVANLEISLLSGSTGSPRAMLLVGSTWLEVVLLLRDGRLSTRTWFDMCFDDGPMGSHEGHQPRNGGYEGLISSWIHVQI